MKKFLIFFSFTLLLISCTKSDTTNQSDLVGYVKLHDMSGNPMDNNGGISINAEINGKDLSINSDKTGKFVFSNLETGTYNLTYSGVNLPTIKKYGVTHTGIGSNFIGSLNISPKAEFKITIFQVTGTTTGSYKFSGNYSVNEPRNIIVFFGKSSNVSKDNFLHTMTISGVNGQLPNTINYSNSNLTAKGFVLGETIYAIGYPSTAFPNSYIELETGKLVYPALGEPSNFHSFTIQ
jgi:hypothetical protein